MKINKRYILTRYFFLFLLFASFNFVDASQLGASLYIAPLLENPRVNSNFTATIKTDSLAQPINAVKGVLYFNKDKLEIINISKIGSILNLWVEEPTFSNIEGTLRFQGGVPNPGFIGNGGVVLHVIFRAKGAGVNSLVWKEGEILASDGKGTSILTNLQNSDFFIEESLLNVNSTGKSSGTLPQWAKILIYSNVFLLILVLTIGFYLLIKIIIKAHDRRFHHQHFNEEYDNHNGDRKSEMNNYKNNQDLNSQG